MNTRTQYRAVEPGDIDGSRLRALISAETPDREHEVLLAAGAELDSYRKNPVVLWAHDASLPPIGRAVEVTAEPGVGVWAVNEFAPTPFAQEVLALYRGGFLNAFSVGFRTLASGRGGERGPRVVTRWELVEQSAVAVPANPDALAVAAGDGNLAADWLLKTYYPPADDATLLRRVGLPPGADWPTLAAAVCRFVGFRGGVPLTASQREQVEGGLRREYQRRGRHFPDLADPRRPIFHHDEPTCFEEREMAALVATLRGRAEALRNIARKRLRRGQPLPEIDPLRAAAADLSEVLEAAGDPSGDAADTAPVLAALRETLVMLRDQPQTALTAALDSLRRGGIGGATPAS